MDDYAEVMKLQSTINSMNRPMGKLIAAVSHEYYACLGGMRRAQASGNVELFNRWVCVMHRLIPEIARNPPDRYVKALATVSR